MRLLALLLVLLPAPAFAQERGPVLLSLYAGYAAGNALDVQSTWRAVEAGAREGNPLMRPCVGRGLACMVPLKAATTAGTIWMVDRFVRPHSKEAAIATMLAITALQVAVVVTNYSQRTAR